MSDIDNYNFMIFPQLNYLTAHILLKYLLILDAEFATTDLLMVFYACGLLVSVPFLLMTIAAYAITPRLMDVHGRALCHYCGCLAIAFTALVLAQLAGDYTSERFVYL